MSDPDAYTRVIGAIIEYDDTPNGTYANRDDMASDMAHDILLAIGFDDLLAACKSAYDHVSLGFKTDAERAQARDDLADTLRAAIAAVEGDNNVPVTEEVVCAVCGKVTTNAYSYVSTISVPILGPLCPSCSSKVR